MLLAALLGAFGGGARVTLEDATIIDSGPGLSIASYLLSADGIIRSFQLNEDPDTVQLGTWVTPASAAPGSYKVRATLQSGTLAEGTTDEWLALTSNRVWTVSDNSAILLIEISLDESTILGSATITLQATVT